jgi:hypothetical protein
MEEKPTSGTIVAVAELFCDQNQMRQLHGSAKGGMPWSRSRPRSADSVCTAWVGLAAMRSCLRDRCRFVGARASMATQFPK